MPKGAGEWSRKRQRPEDNSSVAWPVPALANERPGRITGAEPAASLKPIANSIELAWATRSAKLFKRIGKEDTVDGGTTTPSSQPLRLADGDILTSNSTALSGASQPPLLSPYTASITGAPKNATSDGPVSAGEDSEDGLLGYDARISENAGLGFQDGTLAGSGGGKGSGSAATSSASRGFAPLRRALLGGRRHGSRVADVVDVGKSSPSQMRRSKMGRGVSTARLTGNNVEEDDDEEPGRSSVGRAKKNRKLSPTTTVMMDGE